MGIYNNMFGDKDFGGKRGKQIDYAFKRTKIEIDNKHIKLTMEIDSDNTFRNYVEPKKKKNRGIDE